MRTKVATRLYDGVTLHGVQVQRYLRGGDLQPSGSHVSFDGDVVGVLEQRFRCRVDGRLSTRPFVLRRPPAVQSARGGRTGWNLEGVASY